MKKFLKDVNWRRSYPRVIEGGGFLLKQRTWGRRLIYEVFLSETGEALGTCQVFETADKLECKCKGQCPICKCISEKFVVREQVGLPKLKAKLQQIQSLIRSTI